MAIKNMYYSKQGQNADAAAVKNKKHLEFTHIKIGNANIEKDNPGHEPENCSFITPESESKYIDIKKISSEKNRFWVSADISNSKDELKEGYKITEIALMCQDPNDRTKEIIYSYGNLITSTAEGEKIVADADIIPAYSNGNVYSHIVNIQVIVNAGIEDKEIIISNNSYEDRTTRTEEDIKVMTRNGFIIYNQETFDEWINSANKKKSTDNQEAIEQTNRTKDYTCIKIIEQRDENGNVKNYEFARGKTNGTIDLTALGTKMIEGYGEVIIDANIGYDPEKEPIHGTSLLYPSAPGYMISNIKLGTGKFFKNCKLLLNCKGACENCGTYQDETDIITDNNIKDWDGNYVKFLKDNDALIFVVEKEEDVKLPVVQINGDGWKIISKEYIKEEL